MKLLVLLFSLVAIPAMAQETLDLEKNKDCELFAQKKDYDVQQRIEEIKALVGKTVTVYQVKPKNNQVQLVYTGVVRMADYPKITDKDLASLIVVDDTINKRAYFPLTNDPSYRIYLTEKMK